MKPKGLYSCELEKEDFFIWHGCPNPNPFLEDLGIKPWPKWQKNWHPIAPEKLFDVYMIYLDGHLDATFEVFGKSFIYLGHGL